MSLLKSLALVATALLLAACGGATHTTASTVTVTQPVTVEPPPSQAAAHQPPPARAPKAVIDDYGSSLSVIDNDGKYLVYTDIMPGRYRNAGGAMCYWARLRSLDASDIIDSRMSGVSQIVEIHEDDTAFLTQNCGTWQMVHVPSPWEF
ncbi:hypothetical protein MSIMFB_02403 [Mycobacterium simulans]|uniref:Lipoprotein n=1 Tax=Mycobacterium simulans TaxID=627089 RepID=A0A7Z7IM65_9MYCO|nr:hypothetical protein [Mycobacterium simulans]SOJ54912.1 hypothetical protein MSIMFB_02403 [Mycobacterium simulans]